MTIQDLPKTIELKNKRTDSMEKHELRVTTTETTIGSGEKKYKWSLAYFNKESRQLHLHAEGSSEAEVAGEMKKNLKLKGIDL